MRFSLGGCLVTGLISLSAVGALASDTKTPFPSCTTAPTEADRKAAQGAFAAGQGSFNEADYATAITYWRDAYRRDCTAHALLLNLARAYELKTDRTEAVNALETYLQRKPDAPDADQIRRRIENLKSQTVAAAPPTAPRRPSRRPPSQPPPPRRPGAEAAEKGRRTWRDPFHRRRCRRRYRDRGAVLLATGLKNENDASDKCPSRKNCTQEVTDQGNTARTQEQIGGALLGVGGAAIAGGLIWYFAASPSSGSAQSPSHGTTAGLAPSIAPGFAGVSLAGSF